jgi:hypothetical protein
MLELPLFQASGCFMSTPSQCLRCHGLRHRAKDCLRSRRRPPLSSPPCPDARVAPRGRPPVSDGQLLLTTVAACGDLTLTLSTSDDLGAIALAAAKAAIVAALHLEDDDFTLTPALFELFVATFRSQELWERASAVSATQENPSLSSGQLGHSEVVAPVSPMEVLPSVEVVSSGEVLPSVELVVPTAAVPRVAVPPSIEVLTEEVPSVGVPQSTESASGWSGRQRMVVSRPWRTLSTTLRKVFRHPFWTSRLPAVVLTPSSATHLLNCLRRRLLASGEAVAKPWTPSQPSNRQGEEQCY